MRFLTVHVMPWLAALLLSGCFLGYDSRWGSAARSQKAAAARDEPEALRSTPGESPVRAVTRRPVKAFVTADYAAQVTDEKATIARIIEDANDVLGPTLGLRLELQAVQPWGSAPRSLDEALDDLEGTHPADDMAWMIGFMGHPPTLRSDFSELGVARMHGQHFVLRAMNDAAEFDAMAERFDELDEARRRDLYRRRVQHKEVAVFLHELGHTLGVPHEVARATLMHGTYRHDAASFSEDAAALMRLSLLRRLDADAMTEAELASALTGRVQQSAERWVPAERDAWLAALGAGVQGAVDRPEPFLSARWRMLSAAERKAYVEAESLAAEERYEEAFTAASALFDAHPRLYEVQELRCRLAMKKGGDPSWLEAQCEVFSRLDGHAPPPSPW